MPKSRKKILKRVADLPLWYDLSKYEATKYFNTTDWQFELERRWLLFLQVSKNAIPPLEDDLSIHSELAGDFFSNFRFFIAELFMNPIGGEELPEFFPKGEQSKGNLFVKSLDVGTISWLHKHVHASLGNLINDDTLLTDKYYIALMGRSDKRLKLSVDEVISNVEADFGNNTTICLDMTAPDEVLIAEFKAWLVNSRQKFKIPAPKRSFTAKDFTKWSDHQVLPYLDLHLWELVQRVKITHKLMGEAIFPDELDLDTTDKVRQTVVPLAERLIDSEVVLSLKAQQRSENRE